MTMRQVSKIQMIKRGYIKYYLVCKNDTAVTEVFKNDFMPVKLRHFKNGLHITRPFDVPGLIPPLAYFLPPDDAMFYGYAGRINAMEKAKAGHWFILMQ
jgi:hypothetical protein